MMAIGQMTIGGLDGSVDVSTTVAAIRGVIQDPSADPTLTLLVGSIVLIAVLLLVVLALIAVTPSRKKVTRIRRYAGVRPDASAVDEDADSDVVPEVDAATDERASRTHAGGIVVALLVATALIGTYAATSTDAFCAKTCHTTSAGVEGASRSGHASCVSCHEVGGPGGLLANSSSRLRMAVRYALGSDPDVGAGDVDSRACLGCHGSLRETVVVSTAGTRMSHAEVIRAGWQCTACHDGSGHSEVGFTSTMSECLVCHDAEQASAECTTCHETDPANISIVDSTAKTLGSGSTVYPAVRAAKRECGGCHDEESECDSCHGIRMPHSVEFIQGSHARAAAFDLKLRCWRCHDPQWCSSSGCHIAGFNAQNGSTSHGDDWKQQHKLAAWDSGCACHQGRTRRTAPICTLCHASDHSLLPSP